MTGVDYTILDAQIKKTLEPTPQRPNPLVIWNVRVQDPLGNVIECERSKRPENKLIPGQVLYGYIEDREGGYPPVLKETQRPNGGQPQAQPNQAFGQALPPAPQGFPQQQLVPPAAPTPQVPPPASQMTGPTGQPPKPKDDFERRPDHPLTVKRARHTAAMSATPDYYRLFREEMVLVKPETVEAMQTTLAGITAWIEGGYPPDPRDADEDIPF